MNPPPKHPCPGCNGTGQMTYFGGVSRFQFSYEECPECSGIGFLEPAPDICLQPEHIAADTTLSHPQLENFLHLLAQVLSESLLQGETVQLRGFGNFSLSASKPGKKSLRFTPGVQLQNSLNSTER